MQDCWVDEEGNVHRRHGLSLLCDLGTGAAIDGLFWWDDRESVLAVSDGETYEITANDGTNALLSGDSFETGTRVIFSDYGDEAVYAANGAKIMRIATALSFDASTGSFTAGNTITGATSGATATIVKVEQAASEGTLHLTDVVGTFQNNEIIYEASYGDEMLAVPDMEADTDWTNWGTPTTHERSTDQKHAGTYSRKLVGNSDADGMVDEVTTEVGCFYIASGWLYISALTATSATLALLRSDTSAYYDYTAETTTGSWQQQASMVYQALTTGTYVVSAQQGAGAATWYCDDLSHKKITNAALANGTLSTLEVVEIVDADAPTEVTHPIVFDTYLLANEVDSAYCHYSAVGAPNTWDAEYITAESKPDNLVAQIAENLEIYLMGKKTLEVWYDDGVTPFVRQSQGYVNSGCIAPYSFKLCADVLYWLDQERNVVRMSPDSRTPQVLSVTMNKYIDGFTTVTDALGDYIHVGGRPYYVLTFPTEEKTLVWDIIKSYWYEWGYWNSSEAAYENWLGNCHTIAIGWNKALVGDRSSGKIYTLDPETYDDNSDTLRTLIRTPHINHNSDSIRKRSNRLIFRLKRTEIADSADATSMTIRWRDDGSSDWKNERTVSLTQIGNTEFRGTLNRNGSYYSRQYELVLSDDTPLTLVSVEEDVEYTKS